MSIEDEVTVNAETIKLVSTSTLRRLLALVEDELEDRRAMAAGADPDELEDDEIDELDEE